MPDYPIVYDKDNVTYFRASSFGHCPRNFIFARKLQPQFIPQNMQHAFDEGKTLEPEVLSMLESRGWTIDSHGKEVILPLSSTVHIIGHIDALAYPPTTYHDTKLRWGRIVEVKCLSHAQTERFRDNWRRAFPSYAMQLSCYMLALETEGTFAIYDKGEKELHLIDVPTPPYSFDDLYHRGLTLLQDYKLNLESDILPACEKSSFCPYWHLHSEYADDDAYAIDSDPVLMSLVIAYESMASRVSSFTHAKDVIREQLEEYLTDHAITTADSPTHSLSYSTVTQHRLDTKAVTNHLREIGVLSDFQRPSTYQRLVVTQKDNNATDNSPQVP